MSKKLALKFFSMALSICLLSCSQNTFNTKEELWDYIKNPNNEYVQTKTVNEVDFSILYKPTDLLVDQELGKNIAPSKVDSLRKKYDQNLYFNVSISKNNKELLSNVGNKSRFGKMVNQLAFGMKEKIHFYTPQKDTVPMTDYSYPRMYGMTNSTTILLVYPKNKKVTFSEFMTLTIEDLGFYTGEIKFKIPTSIIDDEPHLKF